ncbi:hypothetical protein [Fibrobacter succinogenes]|uniref:hypothetical protein n=1 Tax=Fibrobacter succinogenes TaxID=833 RepID=UPI00156918E1|nr:hypothetical protein [Fibrobacter succinogenes]
MEFEELKPRNRTKMAVAACLGGFVGAHNFMLANSVSGSIKIYLTLVALIAPHHVGLCMALVNFAWVLFDLWQICFVKTLPEIRFEGSRKKAALVVFVYLSIAAVLAFFFIRNYGA